MHPDILYVSNLDEVIINGPINNEYGYPIDVYNFHLYVDPNDLIPTCDICIKYRYADEMAYNIVMNDDYNSEVYVKTIGSIKGSYKDITNFIVEFSTYIDSTFNEIKYRSCDFGWSAIENCGGNWDEN